MSVSLNFAKPGTHLRGNPGLAEFSRKMAMRCWPGAEDLSRRRTGQRRQLRAAVACSCRESHAKAAATLIRFEGADGGKRRLRPLAPVLFDGRGRGRQNLTRIPDNAVMLLVKPLAAPDVEECAKPPASSE